MMIKVLDTILIDIFETQVAETIGAKVDESF